MSILESGVQTDQAPTALYVSPQSESQSNTPPGEAWPQHTLGTSQETHLSASSRGYDQAFGLETFRTDSYRSRPEPEAPDFDFSMSNTDDFHTAFLDAKSLQHEGPTVDMLTPENERELIDIYFRLIQGWLPLLHQPRFYKKYLERRPGRKLDLESFSIEERLLFISMFALAARHSNSPVFAGVARLDRGEKLFEEARLEYKEAREAIDPPNLIYLQGCILLAFYGYTSGPNAKAWILSGVCSSLAYELDLMELDEDDSETLDTEDWVRREELRRAFWLVFDLDTFGSSMTKRPFLIDQRRMKVLLPVSDEAWFAETPVSSVRLEGPASTAYKCLQGCENQNERAWFLLTNYLMSKLSDINNQQDRVTVEQKAELENVFTCFKLSLPEKFNLETGVFAIEAPGFARCNWIIATLLLLTDYEIAVSQLRTIATSPTVQQTSWSRLSQMRSRAATLTRIITRWPPEFIPLAHPFAACTLPSHHISSDELDQVQPQSFFHHLDVVKLVLSRFAELWKLGAIMLDLTTILENAQEKTPEDLEIARRFAIFFPTSASNKKFRTPSITLKGGGGEVSQSLHESEDALHEGDEAEKTLHHPKVEPADSPMRGQYQMASDQVASDQVAFMPATSAREMSFPAQLPWLPLQESAAVGLSDFVPDNVNWEDQPPNWKTSMLDSFGKPESSDFPEF